MKNREVLIQILLLLRRNGINNEKILFALEQIPPHYYLNLLGYINNYRKINYKELVRLLKILQETLSCKKKLNNVFVSGFKKGWFFSILAIIAKRVYGISLQKKNIFNAELVYSYLKLSNIFLKKGSSLLDWKQVAPFDLIILFENYNVAPIEYLEFLDDKGILFFTKENKNKVTIMKCNKYKNIEKLNIEGFSLNENIIL